MITVGVDAHKRVHVALALDEFGRETSTWKGTNSKRGWDSFQSWLERLGEERRVGVEGAWGYGRGLAQHLVTAGEVVYEVNARWTAAGRRSARESDKTDRLDAYAVALCVHRDGDQLSTIAAEDESATFYNRLRKYMAAPGVPPTGVHILRHSAAKLRRDAGESIEAVSQFLDHSSLAVTTVCLRRLEGPDVRELGQGCRGNWRVRSHLVAEWVRSEMVLRLPDGRRPSAPLLSAAHRPEHA